MRELRPGTVVVQVPAGFFFLLLEPIDDDRSDCWRLLDLDDGRLTSEWTSLLRRVGLGQLYEVVVP